MNNYTMNYSDMAASALAREQCAPGVVQRLNHQNFRVEYVRPDGSIVPDYFYFLELAHRGELHGGFASAHLWN